MADEITHHDVDWLNWYINHSSKLKDYDGCHAFSCGSCLGLKNGRFHREDGPIIANLGGAQNTHIQWFLNGEQYNLDEWARKMGIHGTDEHTMLKLKYG